MLDIVDALKLHESQEPVRSHLLCYADFDGRVE
jgi:hypothetical protein